MSSNVLVYSTMTPATMTGDIVFHLESEDFSSTSTPTTCDINFPDGYNPPDLISIDLTVSSIPASATEIEVADQISIQLGNLLVQQGLDYKGFLSFVEETYPATFQVTKTDHTVTLWSQCRFRTTILSNTCGANIVINDKPLLTTLALFQQEADTIGTDISMFTDQKVINMIKSSSSFICTWLRQNVVLTTYAEELNGNDTKTVKLAKHPIVDFNQPRCRSKDLLERFSWPNWDKSAFFICHDRGGLTFRGAENLINRNEPFAKDNSVYITYIAGENTIPDVIIGAVLDYSMYRIKNSSGLGEFKSMKGGSGAFAFESNKDILEKILLSIKMYRRRPHGI